MKPILKYERGSLTEKGGGSQGAEIELIKKKKKNP